VTRVRFSAGVRDDFDRIFEFLFEHAPENAAGRIASIVDAIDVLQTSPLIGRPVAYGQRELIISTGARGFLALYRYDPLADDVLVLAVRGQREQGYRR
jgi:toxin ParE1/3/4